MLDVINGLPIQFIGMLLIFVSGIIFTIVLTWYLGEKDEALIDYGYFEEDKVRDDD